MVDSEIQPPEASRTELKRRNVVSALLGAFLLVFHSEASTQSPSNDPTHPLQPGMTTIQLAALIRSRFYEDRQWARDRRGVWSARSTLLRILMFVLSVLGIIFLGIAVLDGFAIAGFVCTAVATAVAALEGFFNWRSRWVAADAALASWHDLEESLFLYVASTPEADLEVESLLAFDRKRRTVWSEMSGTWLSERRSQGSSAAG
jgi:TRAP-type mannitol/chloroaromatic compound transport system permease large subunit